MSLEERVHTTVSYPHGYYDFDDIVGIFGFDPAGNPLPMGRWIPGPPEYGKQRRTHAVAADGSTDSTPPENPAWREGRSVCRACRDEAKRQFEARAAARTQLVHERAGSRPEVQQVHARSGWHRAFQTRWSWAIFFGLSPVLFFYEMARLADERTDEDLAPGYGVTDWQQAAIDALQTAVPVALGVSAVWLIFGYVYVRRWERRRQRRFLEDKRRQQEWRQHVDRVREEATAEAREEGDTTWEAPEVRYHRAPDPMAGVAHVKGFPWAPIVVPAIVTGLVIGISYPIGPPTPQRDLKPYRAQGLRYGVPANWTAAPTRRLENGTRKRFANGSWRLDVLRAPAGTAPLISPSEDTPWVSGGRGIRGTNGVVDGYLSCGRRSKPCDSWSLGSADDGQLVLLFGGGVGERVQRDIASSVTPVDP